jgi:hypothetical protein
LRVPGDDALFRSLLVGTFGTTFLGLWTTATTAEFFFTCLLPPLLSVLPLAGSSMTPEHTGVVAALTVMAVLVHLHVQTVWQKRRGLGDTRTWESPFQSRWPCFRFYNSVLSS